MRIFLEAEHEHIVHSLYSQGRRTNLEILQVMPMISQIKSKKDHCDDWEKIETFQNFNLTGNYLFTDFKQNIKESLYR